MSKLIFVVVINTWDFFFALSIYSALSSGSLPCNSVWWVGERELGLFVVYLYTEDTFCSIPLHILWSHLYWRNHYIS